MGVTFIVNPASGRGRTRSQWPALKEEIETLLGDSHELSFLETSDRGDAENLSQRAIESGEEYVVAVGGDGTLNEVLQAVVGTSCALGILPCGTGNDFAREIGMAAEANSIAKSIRERRTMRVDVGRVDFGPDQTSRFFLNIAGCGFDVAVADRVNQGFRAFRGVSAYVAAVVSTLMRYRAIPIRVKSSHGPAETQRLMLVAIANAKCYGGGMKVAPNASIEDGLFDVVLVHEIGRIGFLRSFPKVFSGTHLTHPKVSHFQADTLSIDSDLPQRLLLDGELFGATPATFHVLPNAVEFLVP